MADWVAESRASLLTLRAQHGWGYRLRSTPQIEPTVLASLALAASTPDPSAVFISPWMTEVCQWLRSIQNPNGSFGPSGQLRTPTWPTPFALLLLSARDLSTSKNEYELERQLAGEFLLSVVGKQIDNRKGLGHDGMIPGWPWVEGTHAWVEPTSAAMTALSKEGFGDSQRVADGKKLLVNRSLPQGGWNYGNTTVLGSVLRAQPGPTGWALLGLAGAESRSEPIVLGVKYLSEVLPGLRAAPSLGIGLLALSLWGRTPSPANAWLEEAVGPARERSDLVFQLAHLLLASAPTSALKLLGLSSKIQPAPQLDAGRPVEKKEGDG